MDNFLSGWTRLEDLILEDEDVESSSSGFR
jgi:hypothetical protein